MKIYWKTGESFEGVTEVWIADGGMFGLEIQRQTDDTVVATAWRTIPATYWEPQDVECVFEKEYATIGEATRELEKFDAAAVKCEQELEYLMDPSRFASSE